LKDHEEFEQLRLSQCEEIGNVINKRIKGKIGMKKIRKATMKNMIEEESIIGEVGQISLK
jgi:hypothetical protein